MPNTKKPTAPVASIHLYGNPQAGYDTIVNIRSTTPGQPDIMIGTGDNLRPGRSGTDALFLAVDTLREKGIRRGLVEVHHDFPHRSCVAIIDLGKGCPYFGELPWKTAPGIVISVEAILAAAEKV